MITAVAATVLLGTGLGTTVIVKAHAGSLGTTAASASPSPTEALANAVAVLATTKPLVDWDEVLSKAMASVSGGSDAKYSVAVLDMKSGKSAVYGSGSFDTASIVKVDILATLLLQAQDKGRQLTTQEKAYAKVMIENSDNTAASALWKDIGRASGLNAANRRLGLTETTGGSGALWGLTQTTAADQLRLLRVVFGTDSVLDDASQAYIRNLMGQVSSYQDWGVPSASTGDFDVKNGWLQRSQTALWDINSIGRVTYGGRTYLVAVTSKGSTTMNKGIALVEEAAQTAVTSFSRAAAEYGF
ncbi:class A beta-lactamase-related serine hydrolase [Streptomyces sp. NBC_01537]|uniref:serine hydrolase n=1 Tax=Streptomyces sp. NBC_01537 TaxID=2903896 RepID=UPI0038671C12